MWMLPHMRDHNAHHSDNRGTAEATIPPSRRCPCLSNTNQFYTVAVQRWLFCTIAALFRLWLKACHLAWIDSTVSRNLFLARPTNLQCQQFLSFGHPIAGSYVAPPGFGVYLRHSRNVTCDMQEKENSKHGLVAFALQNKEIVSNANIVWVCSTTLVIRSLQCPPISYNSSGFW